MVERELLKDRPDQLNWHARQLGRDAQPLRAGWRKIHVVTRQQRGLNVGEEIVFDEVRWWGKRRLKI